MNTRSSPKPACASRRADSSAASSSSGARHHPHAAPAAAGRRLDQQRVSGRRRPPPRLACSWARPARRPRRAARLGRAACRPSARWPRGAGRRTRPRPRRRPGPAPGSRTGSRTRGAAPRRRVRRAAPTIARRSPGRSSTGTASSASRTWGASASAGGVDGDRRGSQPSQGPDHAARDLAAVGDQHARRTSARASRPGPPPACGCPARGPGGAAARACRRSAPAGRSPVSTPISCSIETTSSVATLPVAPGGTGQPPSSPKLDSNESTPASSAAYTLASPWPRVLWKWAVSSTSGPAVRARPRRTRGPGRGLAIPVVSPKPISCGAGGDQALGDREHRARARRGPRRGSRTRR